MAVGTGAGAMPGLNSTLPLESLRGPKVTPSTPQAKTEGAEFKRALEQVTSQQPAPSGLVQPDTLGLMGALGAAKPTALPGGASELKFSNHAIERMRSRGIAFQADEMQRIAAAIGKAAAKGAKDTLVL